MQFSLFNSLCLQTNFSLQFNVYCINLHFVPYIVIHSVFYLLKKELCSENVLELSYKIVTGFKQHLNEIIIYNKRRGWENNGERVSIEGNAQNILYTM